MTQISDEAWNILRGATCDGDKLHLNCEILSGDQRPIYDEIKEIIARLGGKWTGGRTAAHVFKFYDPAPLLAGVVASGIMPPKNPTAFFPTPPAVLDMLGIMANVKDFRPYMRILEPSAGTGAIADWLRAKGQEMACEYGWGDDWNWQIDCCEILDLNRAVLEAKGYQIVGHDFPSYNPGDVYDAVLMNPPFSLPGDPMAWETHIRHAWTLLKDGGELGAITASGWPSKSDKRSVAFLDFVCDFGSAIEIEAGAFKESGTGVATMALGLTKIDKTTCLQEPYNGHPSWHIWAAQIYVEQDPKFNERVQRAFIHEDASDRAFTIRKIYDECALQVKREHFEYIRLGDQEHAHILRNVEAAWALENGLPVPEVAPEPIAVSAFTTTPVRAETLSLFAEAH